MEKTMKTPESRSFFMRFDQYLPLRTINLLKSIEIHNLRDKLKIASSFLKLRSDRDKFFLETARRLGHKDLHAVSATSTIVMSQTDEFHHITLFTPTGMKKIDVPQCNL